MPDRRRFPPPWSIEEHNEACFIVRDGTGQALGYFYFEEEPGRRSAAKPLTKDEAPTAARRTALKPLRRWKYPQKLSVITPSVRRTAIRAKATVVNIAKALNSATCSSASCV